MNQKKRLIHEKPLLTDPGNDKTNVSSTQNTETFHLDLSPIKNTNINSSIHFRKDDIRYLTPNKLLNDQSLISNTTTHKIGRILKSDHKNLNAIDLSHYKITNKKLPYDKVKERNSVSANKTKSTAYRSRQSTKTTFLNSYDNNITNSFQNDTNSSVAYGKSQLGTSSILTTVYENGVNKSVNIQDKRKNSGFADNISSAYDDECLLTELYRKINILLN